MFRRPRVPVDPGFFFVVAGAAMARIYKNKKSGGCSLCKPHKHKKADKLKRKVRDLYNRTDREIISVVGF